MFAQRCASGAVVTHAPSTRAIALDGRETRAAGRERLARRHPLPRPRGATQALHASRRLAGHIQAGSRALRPPGRSTGTVPAGPLGELNGRRGRRPRRRSAARLAGGRGLAPSGPLAPRRAWRSCRRASGTRWGSVDDLAVRRDRGGHDVLLAGRGRGVPRRAGLYAPEVKGIPPVRTLVAQAVQAEEHPGAQAQSRRVHGQPRTRRPAGSHGATPPAAAETARGEGRAAGVARGCLGGDAASGVL